MKIAKMLGLAMVAALTTMAFTAGTATAEHGGKHSALCVKKAVKDTQGTEDVKVCPAGEDPGEHGVKEANLNGEDQPEESGLFVGSDGSEIECDNNTFKSTIESTGTHPDQQIIGSINELRFEENCELRENNTCKGVGEPIVSKNKGSVQLEWDQQTQPQGHIQIVEPETSFELLDCTFFQFNVTCTYGGNEGEEVEGKVSDPEQNEAGEITKNGQIEVENQKVNQSGGSGQCPESGNQTVGYQVQAENVITQDQTEWAVTQLWLAKHQDPIS